jgi:hypothetical protein
MPSKSNFSEQAKRFLTQLNKAREIHKSLTTNDVVFYINDEGEKVQINWSDPPCSGILFSEQ